MLIPQFSKRVFWYKHESGPEKVSLGTVFRVSDPRDGWFLEKRWILGGVYQDGGQRHGRRVRFRDGVE